MRELTRIVLVLLARVLSRWHRPEPTGMPLEILEHDVLEGDLGHEGCWRCRYA